MMAKVTLEDGQVVDALVILKSNIQDYLEDARKLHAKARDNQGTPEHISDIGRLRNHLYFLSLTVADLPIRKYKQRNYYPSLEKIGRVG
jgi:hypothetical protein